MTINRAFETYTETRNRIAAAREETISGLAAENVRLRSVLNSLANNVDGLWSLYEPDLRAAMGNTNYQVVLDCIADARAALKTAQRGGD